MQQSSIFKPILILAAAVILLVAMRLGASIVNLILLACFIAALLSPIYGWLKRRIPGGLALLLTIGFLVLVVLCLVLLVGNSLTTLGSSLASYGDQFQQRQAQLQAMAGPMGQTAAFKQLISVLDPAALAAVLSFILGVAASLFKNGLLVLFITLFVLTEGPQFKVRMEQAFGADHFLPRNTIAVYKVVISYFGLRAIVNLFVAAATTLMLWLLGIEHAGLWGVLTFFMSFIPYIGALFATVPPVLLAYAQGGPGLALLIILLSVVINTLTENIIAPMVMSKGLSLSPTVVFISFIFWMFILGGTGALIAMPLTVALMLFLGSFEETRGLAALMGDIPQPADKPDLLEA
jgi:predicted PurR-regulated permease PerM